MRITALLLLAAGAAWGQSPATWAAGKSPGEAPPPELDLALRGRVTQFFQAHVTGRYRQAEQVVALDSRDYFFEANKPRYLSFHIESIEYSGAFTKASVKVNCEADQFMPGFGKIQVTIPRVTTWKLVNGEWFFYKDPDEPRRTPFGKLTAGPQTGDPNAAPQLPKGPSVEDLERSVRIDRSEVSLGGERLTDELTITHSMPGAVQLIPTLPRVPGLTLKLAPNVIAQNQTARLTFEYSPPKDAAPATYNMSLTVDPTGQSIPITLKVDPTKPIPPKPEAVAAKAPAKPAKKPASRKRPKK